MNGHETPMLLEEMGAPLVSVVLPVYNGDKYLAEAIESILAQTHSDLELIAINDGSTDESQQILDKYTKLDSRVHVVSRENRGLVSTLNEAMGLARGAWIARMDQDDIALPHRLERQLEWLEKTGADITGSWVRRFGTSDKRVIKLRETDAAIKMEMLFCSPFAHPSVMMRTTLAKQLRYDQSWEKAEDYDLWERAAEAGWKMANVPEVLLHYRIHAEQISTRTSRQQQYVEQEIRRRYWRFVFNSMGLNRDGIDEVLKLFEAPLLAIDMNAVDASFVALLQHSQGESRRAILDHVTRRYFTVAASCRNIVSRWGRLNREFGEGWGVITKSKLWVLRVLRIRADGNLFKQLKKLYVWSASR